MSKVGRWNPATTRQSSISPPLPPRRERNVERSAPTTIATTRSPMGATNKRKLSDESELSTSPIVPTVKAMKTTNRSDENTTVDERIASTDREFVRSLTTRLYSPKRLAVYAELIDWTKSELSSSVLKNDRLNVRSRMRGTNGETTNDRVDASANDRDVTRSWLYQPNEIAELLSLEERRANTCFSTKMLDRNITEMRDAMLKAHMFGRLVKESTRAHAKVLKKLKARIVRCCRPLQERHGMMFEVYVNCVKRYSEIDSQFFEFLVNQSVSSIAENPEIMPVMHVLLHLINATPSVTLAQFYTFVFGGNFCFGEVCEFFLDACRSFADDLFSLRTQFILYRYQRLGDGRATTILNQLCATEMFLYPLLLQRTTIDRPVDELTTDDSEEPLLRNGTCRAADVFYDKVYKRLDLMQVIFDYSLRQIKRKSQCQSANPSEEDEKNDVGYLMPGVTTASFLTEFTTWGTSLLEVANLLQWRSDGTNYVDPGNNSIVTNPQGLSKYATTRFLDLLRTLWYDVIRSTGQISSMAVDSDDPTNSYYDNEDNRDYDDYGGRGSSGGGGGGGVGGGGGKSGGETRGNRKKDGCSKGGLRFLDRNSHNSFRENMRDMFDNIGKRYQDFTGCNSNSVAGSSNENVSRESGQNTVVISMTIDKFVRYVDSRNKHDIVLNLYLNRFELAAPSMSRTLTINYEYGNPPRRYRFNERRDVNVNAYVHTAIESMDNYFEIACSRDVINHYLYSRVVPERTTHTTATTMRPPLSSRKNANTTTTTTTTTVINAKRRPAKARSKIETKNYEAEANAIIDSKNITYDSCNGENTNQREMKMYDNLQKKLFDRPFVCEVNDLLMRLPRMISPRDAKRILRSHAFARQLAIILINLTHTFGGRMLQRKDSVGKILNILVDSNGARARRLLLAPLACQSIFERRGDEQDTKDTALARLSMLTATAVVKRISRDAFRASVSYFRRHDNIAATDAVTTTSATYGSIASSITVAGNGRNGEADDDDDYAETASKTDSTKSDVTVTADGRFVYNGMVFSAAHNLATLRRAVELSAKSSSYASSRHDRSFSYRHTSDTDTLLSDSERLMIASIRARRELPVHRVVPVVPSGASTRVENDSFTEVTRNDDKSDLEYNNDETNVSRDDEIVDLIAQQSMPFRVVPLTALTMCNEATMTANRRTDLSDFASSTRAFRSSHVVDNEEFASVASMRDYAASWQLNEFARDHANDKRLLEWIDLAAEEPASSSVIDELSTMSDRAILIHVAAVYLFLLTRERERRHEFQNGGLTEQALRYASSIANTDDDDDDDDDPAIGSAIAAVDRNKYRLNAFAQFSNPRFPLFDECYAAVSRLYSEMNVHSYNTNSLAHGLAHYVLERNSFKIAPDIAFGISVALVTLYIFAHGDREIILFLIRFITAIRFPGQFLKSVLLLQGTSDSGKSEFVSEVLRYVFSCTLTGHISNATLRQGPKDEVNTDLMSMMRSHLCQCDEPENINPELFKNLISNATMKSRYFHQQQTQFLRNLAKIILTVNDAISLRSDAGVITRLKFCLRMIHRFKALHDRDHDTRIDFTKSNATPSISYQFATRCFGQTVDFPQFRIGVFLLMEHYGLDMCTHNDFTYTLYDTICSRRAHIWKRKQKYIASQERKGHGDDDVVPRYVRAIKHLNRTNNDLGLLHKMLIFGLTDDTSRLLKARMKRQEERAERQRDEVDDKRDNDTSSSDSDDDDDSDCSDRDDDRDDENDSEIQDDDENYDDVDFGDPSELAAAWDTRGVRDKRNKSRIAERRADRIREKSITNFVHSIAQALENPILIDQLPEAMKHDVRNLHVMIDPFELLQRRYRIEADSTITLHDNDLFRFLREFVEENGYSVSRSNFKDMVTKIKERIKTDYPQTFDNRTQSFHLVFVPLSLVAN